MTNSNMNTVAERPLPVYRAIFYATLVVGVLDATDGIVFSGFHGQNPIHQMPGLNI